MPRRRSATTSSRSTTRPRRVSAGLIPRGNQILVRMYGQGLGDCFLLAFPRARPAGADAAGASARPVYVLIDCGVIGGTPDGPNRMKRIVRDIKEATRDDAVRDDAGHPMGHLDLLVVTHEHWDHVSGFVQARDEWAQIRVDTLWMAWTESDDPSGLPEVLRTILDRQRRSLAEVADRALRFGLADRHDTVLGLMSFLSDADTEGLSFAAAPTTHDAFNAVKALTKNHVFCEPGDVRRVPGSDAIAYVLGPPRSDARLRQMNPSRRDRETFEDEPAQPNGAGVGRPSGMTFAADDPTFSLRQMSEGRSAFNAFTTALLGASMAAAPDGSASPADRAGRSRAGGSGSDADLDRLAEMDVYDRSFPFDRALRVPMAIAEAAANADPAGYPAFASYQEEVNHWRRIDFDWLSSAEEFALQADTLTNNTCLVLAFELPRTSPTVEPKILLFVGDAQVGNWLSWDDISAWSRHDGAAPSQATPDIGDLLKRTVFYKVGHHGSHNATLKANGVERMRDDRTMTAFVPVSPIVARELKDWCQMPLDVLLDALSERTGGRVVLATGDIWPTVGPEQLEQARAEIGVTVSSTMLPPKVRRRDGKEIEGAVPLWTQTAISY